MCPHDGATSQDPCPSPWGRLSKATPWTLSSPPSSPMEAVEPLLLPGRLVTQRLSMSALPPSDRGLELMPSLHACRQVLTALPEAVRPGRHEGGLIDPCQPLTSLQGSRSVPLLPALTPAPPSSAGQRRRPSSSTSDTKGRGVASRTHVGRPSSRASKAANVIMPRVDIDDLFSGMEIEL